eukprot:9523988-Karenia_brevis.AAC.1
MALKSGKMGLDGSMQLRHVDSEQARRLATDLIQHGLIDTDGDATRQKGQKSHRWACKTRDNM